jgi:hypothetical protein
MANEEDQNPNITDCRGHDIYLPRIMSPHQHAADGHRNEPRNFPPGFSVISWLNCLSGLLKLGQGACFANTFAAYIRFSALSEHGSTRPPPTYY